MNGNVHQTNSEGIEANSASAPLASDGVRGWFITVEGIDGAGKSSHVEAMVQALQAQGQPVIHTREPGGTDLGEKIRALLLHESMDPLTEVLLAFASRRQHLREVIVPALLRGTTVVCDRFTDATFAYQGGGRGVAWALIEQLEAQVQGDYQEALAAMRTPAHTAVAAVPREFLQPDCTLWFDVPPAVAAARLEKARTPDRFEAQARDFFESVANAYAQRAAADSARFVRIDADQERTQVQAAVFAALYARGYLQG